MYFIIRPSFAFGTVPIFFGIQSSLVWTFYYFIITYNIITTPKFSSIKILLCSFKIFTIFYLLTFPLAR